MDNRKNYITILSSISIIAMVILHTNGCFWDFNRGATWFSANIIECVFYFAVPIFFMITGVNLIDYQDRYSSKEYLKKRIKKTVIPFLFWSILGVLFFCIKESKLNDIKYIYNSVMGTSIISIYWFFPAIFCVYLSLPLFASVEKSKKLPVFKYLCLMFLILNCLIPFIDSVFNLGLKLPLSIIVCTDYLFFTLVGYILDKVELKKHQRIIIYFFGIIGLLLHIIGTYTFSMSEDNIVKTFKGYENLPSILYSISIFVIVKQISSKINHIKFFEFFSKYTFSIFLLHGFIVYIAEKILHVNTLSLLYRLGAPFIIIPICIIITFILRKIPIVKNIVP